jgi:hypothetical protein
MIVYVESNFILELVLEQEEAQAVNEIVTMAESSQLELVFPIFALIESFNRIISNGEERKKLYNDQLNKQFGQLQRSELHKSFAPTFQSISNELLNIKNIEMRAIEAAMPRLIKVARSLDITSSIFEQAVQKYQKNIFKLGDALIYAAIINDLQLQSHNEPKYFLSRDIKAFGKENAYQGDIKMELQGYNCDYIPKFEDGLKRIQSKLAQP